MILVSLTLAFQANKAVRYAHIAPILNKACVSCHGAKNAVDGINLSSYKTIMKGGDTGAIVNLKKPGDSSLLLVLKGAPGYLKMPLNKPSLKSDEIALIEKWISTGAKP